MPELAAKNETINDILATCHNSCTAIEERLSTIVEPAPSKEPSGPGNAEGAPAEPSTIADTLGQDHLRVVTLRGRLHRIEDHVALAQERLKALA